MTPADLRAPWTHHPVYLAGSGGTVLTRDEILDATGQVVIHDVTRSEVASVAAAAPELLDALQDILGDTEFGCDRPAYLKARAAIRKAEGKL